MLEYLTSGFYSLEGELKMTEELKKMCEDYIFNRDEVMKVFKVENALAYPVCSNIFLSHQKKADAERLKECKTVIKNNTGVFNDFRSTIAAPTACLLSCTNDPDSMMKKALEYHKILGKHFFASSYIVLPALLMTEFATPEIVSEKAAKGEEIFKLMRKKHPFLTGDEDSVFAVMLAFSKKSSEEINDEIEKCFASLKGFASQNYIQLVAQILSLSDKPVEEKYERFIRLYDGLRSAGLKYGKYYELSVLASLAISDIDISALISDISEVDSFLQDQKGYKGLFGIDKKTRLMHAAMLVSTYYSPTERESIAAAASAMISAVISEMLMMIVIATSASTAMMTSH